MHTTNNTENGSTGCNELWHSTKCALCGVYGIGKGKYHGKYGIDRGYHSEVARLHSINGNRDKIFIVTNATGRYDLLALQPSFALFTEFSFLRQD